ncbi:MAG: hypothetical protein FWB76_00460 [Oscillospiraceae bacterium]|nr:hypothetical protein [Oscillospiraceae bacterium]
MNITKMGPLLDLHDYYTFRLAQHATDYMLKASKRGHELHFDETKQKLAIINEIIAEVEGTA